MGSKNLTPAPNQGLGTHGSPNLSECYCYTNWMTEHQQKSEAGTSEVLERLLAHRNDFLRFLEKRVESRSVAEDILQSAFIRGIEKASTLRDEESVVAWFYRMLRNAAVDHYRSRDPLHEFLKSGRKVSTFPTSRCSL